MTSNIDTKTAGYGALLLRLSLGILFLAHDGLKFFVFTPAGTEHFFASLGLPGWFGIFVMLWELAAAIALILGIWPRLAALLIAPDLIGAIVMVHIHNGFFFMAKGGGWEYPAFWTIALIALALIGDGPCTLLPTPGRKTA
ncbi:MAG: DoxX family protein [Acidocella sp.]|nr:DoxX family protein [Acidocella sp.]